MKKIIVLFIFGIGISSHMTISAKDFPADGTIQSSDVEVYADIKEWRYKIMNGKIYKRLFNASKNRWETDWILVK